MAKDKECKLNKQNNDGKIEQLEKNNTNRLYKKNRTIRANKNTGRMTQTEELEQTQQIELI